MAIAQDYQTIPGIVAAGNLAASQFLVVKFSGTTASAVKVVAAVTDTGVGVLQNAPKDGQAAEVAYSGICKVKSGTSVGWFNGRSVGFDNAGKAVPRSTAVSTFPWPVTIGRYLHLESSVANGQIVTIVVAPGIMPDN